MLIIATAMRYNAAAATLPLLLLLFETNLRGWRRYAAAVLAWVFTSVAAMTASRALTEQKDHAWHSSVAIMDIVGTVRFTYFRDHNSDEDFERLFQGTPLAVHKDILKSCRWWYTPYAHWSMSHGDRRIFDPPTTDAEREAIQALWWRLVTEQPSAYLRNRWEVFTHVVGDRPGALMEALWEGFVELPEQEKSVEVSTRHSALQERWLEVHRWLADTFVFCPRFYFFIALLLIPFVRSRISCAVLASGVCYELGLFFVAPSADVRYSHWMTVCTLVALVLIFVERIRRGRASV